MKVLIESTAVDVRSGVKNDKPWTINSQSVRIMSDFVRGLAVVNLPDANKPYPIGEYDLDLERNFSIGGFGRLELNRNITLSPKSQSQVRSA